MTKPIIKQADLVREVKRLVAENPDFVYMNGGAYDSNEDVPTCSYVTGDNGQGCIFGQALINLGVDKEELSYWEQFNSGETSIADLLDHHGRGGQPLKYENEGYGSITYRSFETLQKHQDMGRTWKESLRITESNYPEVWGNNG